MENMKRTKRAEVDYQPDGLQLFSVRSLGFMTPDRLKNILESAAKTGKYIGSKTSQRVGMNVHVGVDSVRKYKKN